MEDDDYATPEAKALRDKYDRRFETFLLGALDLLLIYMAVSGVGNLRHGRCVDGPTLLFTGFAMLYVIAVLTISLWRILSGDTHSLSQLWTELASAYKGRPVLMTVFVIAMLGIFYSATARYHTYDRDGRTYIYDRLLQHGQYYYAEYCPPEPDEDQE